MVVGIDFVRVVLGPLFSVIFSGIKAGGSDEAAFVFSVTKGGAVLVHVHRRLVTLGIRADGGDFFFPSESVVTTAINKDFGRRVSFFDKGEDVASGFIDSCAAALETGIRDCDFSPPSDVTIGGTARADVPVPPGGD